MSQVKEEFVAMFRGGFGNSNVKYSLVQCRILTDNRSEYKFLGKKSIASLWGGDWMPGPSHLDKEDYIPVDLFQGDSEYRSCRIYNISLTREGYTVEDEYELMRLKIKNLQTNIMTLTEELASAKEGLKDVNFEDRRKTREIEDAKHYKELRSNISYVDYAGRGV